LTVPELNGGEGVVFLVWEAAPKLKDASGPAYEERGGVPWLGTDGAAENRGGVVAMAYRRKAAMGARSKSMGKVLFYSCTLRGGNAAGAEGEREVTA
jgi:hypothetical protein